MCDVVPRNYDASLHPLQAPREYVRALNSVKLERVFAKPFLGSLDGHKDGISCLGKHPRHLSVMLSGSCDGEVNTAGHVNDVMSLCYYYRYLLLLLVFCYFLVLVILCS